MSRDWGNDIITIQGVGIAKTIPIIKKLGTLIKCPKVLVCYDFHFGIFNEEEDLMFVIELIIFSIGTIVVPTLILTHPQAPRWTHYKSKGEDRGRRRS